MLLKSTKPLVINFTNCWINVDFKGRGNFVLPKLRTNQTLYSIFSKHTHNFVVDWPLVEEQ